MPYKEGENTEPYYPILTQESRKLHEKYMDELKRIPNLICCGRLADFQYYNMDQALKRAIECAEKITDIRNSK